HFSKYIRPDSKRIGLEFSDDSILATAAQNPDGSIIVVLLNQTESSKQITLNLGDKTTDIMIDGQAIQTVLIKK
ncbi:MAG: glucosylceramidase, partial [Bacteroidia bacterium]